MRRALAITAAFTCLMLGNAAVDRAIIRPGSPGHDDPDDPTNPDSPTNPDHPFNGINGIEPAPSTGYPGSAGESSDHGTATESSNPCENGPEEWCEHLIEIAKEVVSQILSAVQGGPSTSTSASLAPYPTGPAGVGGNNITSSNRTYAAPLPNYNVSSTMDLGQYYDLFTSDEFDMYRENRACFYANIEREYVSAASSASSTATASIITATPARRSPQDPLASAINNPNPAEQSSAASEDSSLSVESKVSTLYYNVLPSQLTNIYNQAVPTSLVVTATSTGTCQGLDNSTSFVTSWAVYGYKEGYSPTPSPTAPTTTPTTGAANRAKSHFALVLGALFAGIVFSI